MQTPEEAREIVEEAIINLKKRKTLEAGSTVKGRRYVSLFYYDKIYAERLRPVLEKLVSSPDSIQIDSRKLFLLPASLYKQITQAWLYLIDHAEDAEEKARLFDLRKATTIGIRASYVFLWKNPKREGADLISIAESVSTEVCAVKLGKDLGEISEETILDAEVVEEQKLLEEHTTMDWERDIIGWLNQATLGCDPLDRVGLNLGELEKGKIRNIHEGYKANIALIRLNHAGYRMIFNPEIARDLHGK